MQFKLNKTLEKDTYLIKETDKYLLLLNKNSLVTWLILVPKTNETQLFECSQEFKIDILKAIDLYANKLNNKLNPDKINVATIGNIVSQLHIHIIARFTDDYAWPSPVWGNSDFKKYNQNQLDKIINLFNK